MLTRYALTFLLSDGTKMSIVVRTFGFSQAIEKGCAQENLCESMLQSIAVVVCTTPSMVD